MTVTESTGWAPSGASEVAAVEPGTAHEWLESVIARVQRHHPAADPSLVERRVDEAARHFDDAGVHIYLPILVERRASLAVKAALTRPTASTLDPGEPS